MNICVIHSFCLESIYIYFFFFFFGGGGVNWYCNFVPVTRTGLRLSISWLLRLVVFKKYSWFVQ